MHYSINNYMCAVCIVDQHFGVDEKSPGRPWVKRFLDQEDKPN